MIPVSSRPLSRLRVCLLMGLLGFLLVPLSSVVADDEATPIRLVDTFSLSPDGEQVVFSWRDDIWIASTEGGDARRLTTHPGRDRHPWISPGGADLAWVSNRTGSDQVFVMPLAGGLSRQVTTHSEGFVLYGWFPEGDALLVRSAQDHYWRRAERFFRRTLDPRDPLELLFDAYGGSAALSPDGRRIAFVREGERWTRKGYHGPRAGQIWVFDRDTRKYMKRTTGDHGERWPQWSADGRTIYYASQEDGTFNLWRMDADGGARQQITHYEDDGALFPRISHDGKSLVLRHLFDLEVVALDAPNDDVQPRPLTLTHRGVPTVEPLERRTLKRATQVAFSEDAREIAFVSGGDVWVMDTELKEPRQVTNTAAEERDPVFSADFETLYFVSDHAGQPDVFAARRDDPDKYWWQNDTFVYERLTNDATPESTLRLTPDGKRLAFVHGRGNVMTMALDGSDRETLIEGWDEPDFDFSPDGKWIAWSVQDDDFNSDVWIRPLDAHIEPVNVSRHPDHDMSPRWSPDGKLLAFTGRRYEDETDIYYVWLDKEDGEENRRDRTLEKALKKMKGRKKPKPASEPKVADPNAADPNRAGLATPDAAKDAPTAPSGHPLVGSWSGRLLGPPPLPPEGLVLELEVVRAGEDLIARLEVPGQMQIDEIPVAFDDEARSVSFEAASPLGLLTVSGSLEGPKVSGDWSIGELMKGTFDLTRSADTPSATGDEPPAAKGSAAEAKPDSSAPSKKRAKEPELPVVTIDIDDIADRLRRIAINDSDESGLLWSPDGKTLAFQATIGGTAGTYKVTFPDELDKPKKLSGTRGSGGRWLKAGNQIAWLVGGTPGTLSSKGKTASYGFSVRQEVDPSAEHAAAFDQAWRIMGEAFYDERLGNRDWDAVRAKYRAMAEACMTGSELEVVVNMMLGELNGSHLGFRSTARRWSAPGWKTFTAHLGLRFDPLYEGDGLRVGEVIEGGPASEQKHRIETGEVVISIDGRPVGPKTNLARLLTGVPDRDITVEVENVEGKRRTVEMRPSSYGAIRARLYDAWIEETRAQVDALSNGTLGYLHVRGMNWSSFQRFEAELYKVGHGKDGLIIDVRENGGGFTTDHLLTCLTQPSHAITVPRGGGPGYPQGRMVYARWDKPVLVLCNQNSFSNAEIFSHAIKNLGRGQVVGVTTAGGVISTGGTMVMGLGTLRLPFRGWYVAATGEDMEHNGCVPHHELWALPGEMPGGKDRQLEKGVEVLMQDVATWKARPQPTRRKASERK